MDRLIANMIVNDSERLLDLSSTIIYYHDRLNGPCSNNQFINVILRGMLQLDDCNSYKHYDCIEQLN